MGDSVLLNKALFFIQTQEKKVHEEILFPFLNVFYTSLIWMSWSALNIFLWLKELPSYTRRLPLLAQILVDVFFNTRDVRTDILWPLLDLCDYLMFIVKCGIQ